MAGIGFQLEKLSQKGTWTASVNSYLHSGVIVAGPWLLSILTVLFLQFFKPKALSSNSFLEFRGILIHIFAISLMSFGFLYHSLTRHISDNLYKDKNNSLAPTLISSMIFILIIQTIIGFLYFGFLEITLIIKILACMIYLVVSALWIQMIFLTALKNFNIITKTYLYSLFIIVILSVSLSRLIGIEGYFIGYLIGNLWILINLSSTLFKEFHSSTIFDWSFLNSIKKYWVLSIAGLFYNIGVWIDKLVLWQTAEFSEVIIPPTISVFNLYDSVVFIAYISIIPTLAFFIMHIENNFFKVYHIFYIDILLNGNLNTIKKTKDNMMGIISKGFKGIVLYQGMITVLFILFAPSIIKLVRLQPLQIPLFRITLLAAFIHALFLVAIMIVLYFDFRKLAMYSSLAFMVLNGVLTYILNRIDFIFLGIGYLLACLVSLLIASMGFFILFENLEYNTFNSQLDP
ncbi:MAG: exopolysaccharide Pel transporter PelG [Bacteroidetes bacterium]|nr:exopolysaccharide Pel transporter PelG [Bacteroidota bacterium]